MSHDQCISCGNFHAWDDTCRPCPVSQDDELPAILQLQADPFPTESDTLAEQGFIEQDASAPIKEQCEENARLMRRIASLEETNRELRILVLDWQETAIAAEQKAKKYEEAFAKMAECMHDLKG